MRYAGENCCGRDIIWDGEGRDRVGHAVMGYMQDPMMDVDDNTHNILNLNI